MSSTLLDGALQRDLPVLGICRGLQIMTVHAGGRLEQHLPDVVGHDEHRPEPGIFGVHEVALARGSSAARILGDAVSVKSYHHQGVADAGSLTIAGRAPTTTPSRRLRYPDGSFAVGVLGIPKPVTTRGCSKPSSRRRRPHSR